MRPILKKGVDISEFNDDVNMAALQREGVEFVIIRCGYGGDYTNQDDQWYERNVKKCIDSGMPWGAYLYSYAKNTDMAVNEAAHTLRLLSGKPNPDYGVWYDVEDAGLPSGSVLPAICKAYCSAIEKAGYQPGIYTFLSWLNQEDRLLSYKSDKELNKYGLWYAQFNDEINYSNTELIHIWQYSDNVQICGKTFDGNYAYVEFPRGGRDKPGDIGKEKTEGNVKSYRYFEDIPSWGKEAVSYYMQGGIITGLGTDNQGRTILDLSPDFVRICVAMKRKDDMIASGDGPENNK